jgi:hypothetical protein
MSTIDAAEIAAEAGLSRTDRVWSIEARPTGMFITGIDMAGEGRDRHAIRRADAILRHEVADPAHAKGAITAAMRTIGDMLDATEPAA